jgi:hypothetical protein
MIAKRSPYAAAALLAAGTLLAPNAQARNWQVYLDQSFQSLEVDADSIRPAAELVYFDYRTRLKSSNVLDRPISGVAACAARQRADVGPDGSFQLREVYPDTWMAKQLDAVCGLAGRGVAAAKPAAPAPVAASAAPRVYSDTDGALLWEEALQTFNGLAYDYTLYAFASSEEAENCVFKIQNRCRIKNYETGSRVAVRNNELPLWLREAVMRAQLGDYTRPVQDPADGRWVVARVAKAHAASFGGAVQPRSWVAEHAATALPSADALRTDPELRMRSAMNRVRNAADLQKALAEQRVDRAHLDVPLSSGGTLVIRALDLKDEALLKALAAEGARLDRCGVSICPMTQAIYVRNRAALGWLLALGASPEGSAGDITPLMAAAAMADREAAEMLLRAGADPLASYAEKTMGLSLERSVAFYVPSSETDYLDWWLGVVNAQLAKSQRFEWSAWLEQDNQRRPLADGATIRLKRRPFKLVMKLPDGASFRTLTSADETLAEKSRSAAFRRQAVHGIHIGASSPEGHFLGVAGFSFAEGQWRLDGSTNELAYSAEPDSDRGTRRVSDGRGGHLDIYSVDELVLRSGAVPIKAYTGPSLAMLAGVIPPLGTGADLYKPMRVKLVFE